MPLNQKMKPKLTPMQKMMAGVDKIAKTMNSVSTGLDTTSPKPKNLSGTSNNLEEQEKWKKRVAAGRLGASN